MVSGITLHFPVVVSKIDIMEKLNDMIKRMSVSEATQCFLRIKNVIILRKWLLVILKSWQSNSKYDSNQV